MDRIMTAEAPVKRVALFKNGLALVTRELIIPPGVERLTIAGAPAPVHGTFWVESEESARFSALSRTRTVRKTEKIDRLDWQRVFAQLAGTDVRLVLGENNIIAGRVLASPAVSDRWVIVKTSRGVEMVEPGRIQRLVVEKDDFTLQPDTRKIEKSVTETLLRVRVAKVNKSRTLTFSYLARGAAWSPAYRLDLTDSGPARLDFSAVIRNEMEDWQGARLFLVSGFPALLYERVTSPLAPQQSLDAFFAALSGGGGASYARSRGVMAQAVINVADAAGPGGGTPDFSATDTDFHVRDIGTVDLARGESLWLSLGSAPAAVAKTVEWEIPDSRDERGRPLRRNVRPDEAEMDPLWDTYTFVNPFAFPMTTAPLAVYRQGQVLSQNLCRWTPPGREARVRATRALNLRVEHAENEVEGSREIIKIAGNDHRRVTVRGTLTVENRRPLAQTVMARRTLWGRLLQADGTPATSLLSTGARSLNPRTRLEWRFDLKPGETRTLQYTVEVLVDI